MKLCFVGDSHAAHHLREAARQRGFAITDKPDSAAICFVSQDTPTDEKGNRDETPIRSLIQAHHAHPLLVVTSQVQPGFMRSLGLPNAFHQPETLRIKDASARALNPDYIVVGGATRSPGVPRPYLRYLKRFDCPLFFVSWEEAEFSKIAVNMTLAAQVDNTNRLAVASATIGADWQRIATILAHDKRIGPYSYLEPGRWQDSPHLLRDAVSLAAILRSAPSSSSTPGRS